MLRAVALVVLLALVATPVAALAQEQPQAPDQDQSEKREPVDEEPAIEKQPTERFVYLAVGLLLLFLLYAGVAYVRTVLRTAES